MEDGARARPAAGPSPRAFVLPLAARFLNFRAWNGALAGDAHCLERGGVSITFRSLPSVRELDLAEPYAAAPERGLLRRPRSAARPLEADLREIDPDGARHVLVRTAADLDGASATGRVGVRALRRGRLPPRRRRRTRSPRTSASLPPAASATSRSRTSSSAGSRPTRPRSRSCPTASTTRSSRSRRAACPPLGEAAVRGDVRDAACSSTSATCARPRSTRPSRSSSARPRARRRPAAHPVIASHAAYRFGGQSYNLTAARSADRRPRRRDRADPRPAPAQRRRAAAQDTKTLDESLA